MRFLPTARRVLEEIVAGLARWIEVGKRNPGWRRVDRRSRGACGERGTNERDECDRAERADQTTTADSNLLEK